VLLSWFWDSSEADSITRAWRWHARSMTAMYTRRLRASLAWRMKSEKREDLFGAGFMIFAASLKRLASPPSNRLSHVSSYDLPFGGPLEDHFGSALFLASSGRSSLKDHGPTIRCRARPLRSLQDSLWRRVSFQAAP
jgi:hypothetical protein